MRQDAEPKGLVVAETRHDDPDEPLHALGLRAHLFVVLDPTGGEAGGQLAVDEGRVGDGSRGSWRSGRD
jgi:hypothetical protein